MTHFASVGAIEMGATREFSIHTFAYMFTKKIRYLCYSICVGGRSRRFASAYAMKNVRVCVFKYFAIILLKQFNVGLCKFQIY